MVQMKPEDDSERIAKVVDEFTHHIGRPIKSVAAFYSYYYLTEIRDEDQFEFDHFQTATTLQDALYNYSIYASSMEATNAPIKLSFAGKEIGDIDSDGGETKADLIEYLEGNATHPNLIRGMLVGAYPINYRMKRSGILESAKEFETKYNAFSHSKDYLQALKFIFGHFGLQSTPIQNETKGEMSESEDRPVGKYGWANNYGGPAWAGVCETALHYHEMGKTAFVDLMLSVEHNNGNFMNKVPMNNHNAEILLKEALSEPETPQEQQIVDAVHDNTTAIHQEAFQTILPLLLDMARDEEMLTLLKITAAHDKSVSSWLRKNRDTL